MFTSVDKAIVAVLGGVLTVVAEFGVDTSWATEGLVSGVGSMLTALMVYFVPNKETE